MQHLRRKLGPKTQMALVTMPSQEHGRTLRIFRVNTVLSPGGPASLRLLLPNSLRAPYRLCLTLSLIYFHSPY